MMDHSQADAPMQDSQVSRQGSSEQFDQSKIEFVVVNQSEDFKKNVCIPYFKDIFKVRFIYTTSLLYWTLKRRRAAKLVVANIAYRT